MMTKHKVEIHVEEPVVFEEIEILERAALATLKIHAIDQACELIVVISDDEALQELNRRFRGIDAPTDVLSFANDNRGPYAGLPTGYPRDLGDIVISLDRARNQAESVNADLLDEMQLLVVHGTLHLLGYDHEEEDDKSKMWPVQQEIMQHLGVDIPLPE